MKKLGLIFLFFIVACGKMPQTHYFTLDIQLDEKPASGAAPALYVEQFKSAPMFQQDRFVYKTSDYQINFDHYKRWIDSPVFMLTCRTTEFLRATGMFSHVTVNAPFQTDVLKLSANLVQFNEIASKTERKVVVDIYFVLQNFMTGNILWEGNIRKEKVILSNTMDAEAEVMSAAVSSVLQKLAGHFADVLP